MLRNNRGQILTLIEVLVVAVIILGAGYWVATNYLTAPKSAGKSTVATPIGRATGVSCQNNLQQIRYAINMHVQTNEQPPATLKDLESSGISDALSKCPENNNPYTYDQTQGKVSCTTPGHEKY